MGVFASLEDFSVPESVSDSFDVGDSLQEEDAKLEAFERGYAAGWEDASAAEAGRVAELTDALDMRLRDLSFTYHEALTQMRSNMEPVLRCLFDEILPSAMARTLAPRLSDEVTRLIQGTATTPVVIHVSPGQCEPVLALVSRDHQMPLDVREDPAMARDEARIEIEQASYELDSASVISAAENAINDYLFTALSEVSNA
ncbi:MAG: hypothetical protein HRU31_05275 [Rhodobacteraceae bacterium]|nr:hypothetical protein [Paracoccaceae bacterium]